MGWVAAPLQLPVQGILSPEDAKLAVHAGVDAIVVSNHGARRLVACSAMACVALTPHSAARAPTRLAGGRQLDYVPSALEVLPHVVAAVQGSSVPVLMVSFACAAFLFVCGRAHTRGQRG